MKYFLFVFALLVVATMAYAQQEATFQITADISATPLLVVATDMAIAPLYAGQTIGFAPVGAGDGTTDVSMGGGSTGLAGSAPAVCTAATFAITGDPGARVSIEFSLPSIMLSDAGEPGAIHISYNSTSAIVDDAAAGSAAAGAGVGTYFNPLNGTNLFLDGSGAGMVELAGIFTVEPGSAPAADYTAQGIVTVSYVAN